MTRLRLTERGRDVLAAARLLTALLLTLALASAADQYIR